MKMPKLRKIIYELADDDYRAFSMRIISSKYDIIGVRIPEIRKLIKNIPLQESADYLALKSINFEEVIARGFLIARLPYCDMVEYFDSQVELLDNWCTVDTFCAALRRVVKKHEADFLGKKVIPLLKSNREFSARCGIVCLLDFYVKSEYLSLIFEYVEALATRQDYYVKMALAWLLAECYIKHPVETSYYMQRSTLNAWTLNKAVSKICDSHRVDNKLKDSARKLRK